MSNMKLSLPFRIIDALSATILPVVMAILESDFMWTTITGRAISEACYVDVAI